MSKTIGFVLAPPTPKEGCGKAIHVEGTNGGTMHCGGFLVAFNTVTQQFCAKCAEKRKGT